MRTHLLSGLAVALISWATASLPVAAANFYAVVPVGADPSLVSFSLRSAGLPPAIVGEPFSFSFDGLMSASGLNPAGAQFSSSGPLAQGLALEPNGRLSGTPTDAQQGLAFDVQAKLAGFSATQAYTLNVWPRVEIGLAGENLGTAVVGDAYSASLAQQLTLTGGIGAVAPENVLWEVVAGALPPGLILNEKGDISGIPSDEPGAPSVFTVRVTYQQKSAEQTYQVAALKAFELNTTIAAETTNYDMRQAAVKAGWDGVHPLRMALTVAPGITVGSINADVPALTTGVGFPDGSQLALENNGRILGAGGAGGSGGSALVWGGQALPVVLAKAGGDALRAQTPLVVTNTGTIAGGGGGGGGAPTAWTNSILADGGAGGGGQGYGTSKGGTIARYVENGQFLYPTGAVGQPGSINAPGQGGAGATSGLSPNQFSAPWYAKSGNGGAGGAFGQPGMRSGEGWVASMAPVPARLGGAAGAAIQGAAFVDLHQSGTLLGPVR